MKFSVKPMLQWKTGPSISTEFTFSEKVPDIWVDFLRNQTQEPQDTLGLFGKMIKEKQSYIRTEPSQEMISLASYGRIR